MSMIYGFAEPYKSGANEPLLGGIAYLAGAVDRARHHQPSLLLAAGDMIQGSPGPTCLRANPALK